MRSKLKHIAKSIHRLRIFSNHSESSSFQLYNTYFGLNFSFFSSHISEFYVKYRIHKNAVNWI